MTLRAFSYAINPQEYLTHVVGRLPSMTAKQVRELLNKCPGSLHPTAFAGSRSDGFSQVLPQSESKV
jgi:hypothetical protein